MERPQPDESGFTLVELMVVIGIVGILIAIMIPTLLQARRPAQDRQAQNLLRNSLTAAKAIETSDGAVATAGDPGPRGEPRSTYVGGTTNGAGRPTAGLGRHARPSAASTSSSSRPSHPRVAASPSSSSPSARHSSNASTVPRRVGPRSSTPRPAGRAPGRRGPGPRRRVPRSVASRRHASRVPARRLRPPRPGRRLLPQRRRVAGAPPRVDRPARLALPELRHRAGRDRERARALVGGAPGAVPPLRRTGSRSATRSWSSLTAALWVGLAQRFGATWELPPYLVLAAGLVALSLIDLDHFLLPEPGPVSRPGS